MKLRLKKDLFNHKIGDIAEADKLCNSCGNVCAQHYHIKPENWWRGKKKVSVPTYVCDFYSADLFDIIEEGKVDNNKTLDGKPQDRLGNCSYCSVRYRGECNGNGSDFEGCDKYKPLKPTNDFVRTPGPSGFINDVPHGHSMNETHMQEKLLANILEELRILNNKVKGDLPKDEVGKRFNKLKWDCDELLKSFYDDIQIRGDKMAERIMGIREMYVKRMVELVYDYIGDR